VAGRGVDIVGVAPGCAATTAEAAPGWTAPVVAPGVDTSTEMDGPERAGVPLAGALPAPAAGPSAWPDADADGAVG
jgi:hypothetical protein